MPGTPSNLQPVAPSGNSGSQTRRGFWVALAVLLVALGALATLWPRNPAPAPAAAVLEAERTELVSKDGRLEKGGTVFTGLMLEHYPDGVLKSRSAISNGLLHGLSEGWFTNRVLQVSEQFANGTSHGERHRWDELGRPVSAARIDHGEIAGIFRRWHTNGVVAEEITMRDGQADGPACSWYPSGFLSAEMTMRNGKVVSRQNYADGERREPVKPLARMEAP